MEDCVEQSRDLKEDKRLFSKIGIGFLILVVVTYLAQFAFVKALAPWLREHMDFYTRYQLVFSSLPMYLVGVPAAYLWFRRIPKRETLKTVSWGPGKLCVALLIAYGLLYGSNLVSAFGMYVVGVLRGKPIVNDLAAIVLESDPWVMTIVMVILAPIIEELLFRKILLDRIHPYGEKLCVLVSGLLFGLMHGNFFQFLYAGFLGAVFAYIYLKTGKLRYTIVFHMVINFMGSVVALWFMKMMLNSGIYENPAAMSQHMFQLMLMFGYVFLLFAACISGIVLLICFRKEITFQPGSISLPQGKSALTVFFNLGMILFFLACGAQFVLSFF